MAFEQLSLNSPDPNGIQFTSHCDINKAYAVTMAKMTLLEDACSFYFINYLIYTGIVQVFKRKFNRHL